MAVSRCAPATSTTAGRRRPGRPMAARSQKRPPASTRWASGAGTGSRSSRGTGRSGRKPTSRSFPSARSACPCTRRAQRHRSDMCSATPAARCASSKTPNNWGGCWSSVRICLTSNTSSSSTTTSRSTTHCSCRSRSCVRSGPRRSTATPTSLRAPATRSRRPTSPRSSIRAARPAHPRELCSRTPT